MMRHLRKILFPFLLASLLLVTSCNSQPPSRFEQAQTDSTQRGAGAVVKESESGSSFNKFFPPEGGGYKRVYTQEKKGFAQAKLTKDGKEVALMSITDTLNNTSATSKFQQSSKKIGGYPAVAKGKTSTSVLVADRFQVNIRSKDPSFTESDREAWLAKFKLNDLARLQ